jgi:hypothetical protein
MSRGKCTCVEAWAEGKPAAGPGREDEDENDDDAVAAAPRQFPPGSTVVQLN